LRPPRAWLPTPYTRHPFSRSYGVILPSSLTRVLPRALGSSPRLPVSVCGTGTFNLARGFSRQCELRPFGTSSFPPHHRSASRSADLPTLQPHGLDVLFQSLADLPSCVTPSHKRLKVVQEFQPVVHRLRLSASA